MQCGRVQRGRALYRALSYKSGSALLRRPQQCRYRTMLVQCGVQPQCGQRRLTKDRTVVRPRCTTVLSVLYSPAICLKPTLFTVQYSKCRATAKTLSAPPPSGQPLPHLRYSVSPTTISTDGLQHLECNSRKKPTVTRT